MAVTRKDVFLLPSGANERMLNSLNCHSAEPRSGDADASNHRAVDCRIIKSKSESKAKEGDGAGTFGVCDRGFVQGEGGRGPRGQHWCRRPDVTQKEV